MPEEHKQAETVSHGSGEVQLVELTEIDVDSSPHDKRGSGSPAYADSMYEGSTRKLELDTPHYLQNDDVSRNNQANNYASMHRPSAFEPNDKS